MEIATELANAIVCLSKMNASEGQWSECLNLYRYSLFVQQSAFRRKLGLEDPMPFVLQASIENEPMLIEREIDECTQLYESLSSHHVDPADYLPNSRISRGICL